MSQGGRSPFLDQSRAAPLLLSPPKRQRPRILGGTGRRRELVGFPLHMKHIANQHGYNHPSSATFVNDRASPVEADTIGEGSVRYSSGHLASDSVLPEEGAGAGEGGGDSRPRPLPLDTCHQSEPTPSHGLQTGHTSLNDLPKRLERMGAGIADDLAFAEFLKNNPDQTPLCDGITPSERGRRLSGCGIALEFHTLIDAAGQPTRLNAGMFCRQAHLCSKCARARAARHVVAYAPKITQEAEHRFPYLATFTIKNGPDLAAQFEYLRKGISRFNYRRKHAIQRNTTDPIGLIDGYVGSFEFKRGKGSGLWHPHIHLVLLTSRPLTPEESLRIREVWCECVDAEASPHAQDIRPIVDADAILEVFKYPLKFDELSHDDRWDTFNIMRGRRLVISAGCLRGVTVAESYNDDPFEDQTFTRLLETLYARTEAGYALSSSRLVPISRPQQPIIPPDEIPY